jgi:hypothetical protein
VWQREVGLRGVYAYDEHDDRGHDFATAIDLIRRLDLGRLVSATYPLVRYQDAIDHAANAGRRGAVKVAFDLRAEGATRAGRSHTVYDRTATTRTQGEEESG